MNVIRFLYYFIATIVAVAKSSAEADDVSMLAQRLLESKHIVRGSGLNDEKETGNKEETSSVNQIPKRMLEAGTKRLLQLIPINMDCCEEEYEEIFTASDGNCRRHFGASCSMSDDLVVIGAPWDDDKKGAAYLFNLDGTEVKKLTPEDDGEDGNSFGGSISMDEKIVVGSDDGNYVRVFSRDGIYERTIRCDDCSWFGRSVATLGNLIVTNGKQDDIYKLFVFTAEDGQLLKTLDQGSSYISSVAISEQFIVLIAEYLWTKTTIIYSNTSPDFPKIAEIDQGGTEVAVLGDRIVIGNYNVVYWHTNGYDGAAYLYKTDGTLVTALDRQDASSGSFFGWSVAITDDKVLVSAPEDDDQGENSGSVFIYSAVTGEFNQKVLAPDGEEDDNFGFSVCASGSYFMVGAKGDDTKSGAAYLFQFSDDDIDNYDDDNDKDFVASDGETWDMFGESCSMSDELVVIGADGVDGDKGAAYLFHLNGTEVAKLTPGNDEEGGLFGDSFGTSVSIDEKIVVGTFWGDYIRVFSRNGIYERTIRCDDCSEFGYAVATHGNLIAVDGEQNSTNKLFIYSTEGELEKEIEQGSVKIDDIAMSEQFIVSTSWNLFGGKTLIYSNTSPDFPKIAEIDQGGFKVAVSGDRIVIGDYRVSFNTGVAYLYKTDGTLVTALDRQDDRHDASSGSRFGISVATTDDKVLVGAALDDDQGYWSGSVFIFSAETGEFLEKVLAPDGDDYDWFGSSVCASDSHYVVGAVGVDTYTGAAYLFQSSEE